MRDECAAFDVTFVFCGTGRRFIKDGRLYRLEESGIQSSQAFRSGLSYQGKPLTFDLRDPLGFPIPENELYTPVFRERCRSCGMKMICNGCSNCGKCRNG